ncbi:MAG: CocE/NonD family hydrolase, partial [Pyrinomonadaceae bacterium]
IQKSLYFQPQGRLSFDPPAETGEYDEYVSDPNKPVPYAANTAIGMTREYMVGDQRLTATRPDVLVYQTDILTEDVTIAGPIVASLQVSTSGTDSDWVVKLIDVYPDNASDNDPNPAGVKMGGYQMLVRGEPMRGRFRNSYQKPEAFTPDKPTKVEFTLPDAFHTFKKGHRVMVQIQSSWFPLVDRNPQKFVENIYKASDADFQKATQRVYRSKQLQSQIKLTLLQ